MGRRQPLALVEAVKFCDAKQQILPPWVSAGVLDLLALNPKKRAAAWLVCAGWIGSMLCIGCATTL